AALLDRLYTPCPHCTHPRRERFQSSLTTAESYLDELGAGLREGRYQPHPVKRVDIPRGVGETRPLGIPTVKDRIVQTAVKLVIEPVLSDELRLQAGARRRCAQWRGCFGKATPSWCGKTARTVRRAGRAQALLDPIVRSWSSFRKQVDETHY
ncbi:MAG: hypothetical protein ACREX3_15635, partial [Gammaproteobacteria bacterium]